jgi:hypothetical protein
MFLEALPRSCCHGFDGAVGVVHGAVDGVVDSLPSQGGCAPRCAPALLRVVVWIVSVELIF